MVMFRSYCVKMEFNEVDIMSPDIAKLEESLAKINCTVEQEFQKFKELLQIKDEMITTFKKNINDIVLTYQRDIALRSQKGTNSSEKHTDADFQEMVRILYVSFL